MVSELGRPRLVAIIGAGFIGLGWAVVFARAGCEVRIYDTAPATARKAIAEIERILAAGDPSLRGRVTLCATLEDAVRDADWVQENAPEEAAIKTELLLRADAAAPAGAILASSTSALQPSSFLHALPGRSRSLVAHPFNPPYLLPLVELVPSQWTSPDTVARARAWLAAVGQEPIVVRREVAGFVANRLQAAVISEAISMVGHGVAAPEDIDACMRSALGLRWAFLGPFETMDLNAPRGFGDYVERFGASYQALIADLRVGERWDDAALAAIERSLRDRYPASSLERRNRWRDQMVAKLRFVVDPAQALQAAEFGQASNHRLEE